MVLREMKAFAANSATLAKDKSGLIRSARAVLLPRGALHQSRNHHRPERPRQHLHSAGGFHHYVAHGPAGLHARGALGSGASSLKVFQDFFVDLDLPVTLTQGDRVSIPVAVYNYSGGRAATSASICSRTTGLRWWTTSPTKNLAVDSGRVGGSQFTLEAKRIGKFKLTLSAHDWQRRRRQQARTSWSAKSK